MSKIKIINIIFIFITTIILSIVLCGCAASTDSGKLTSSGEFENGYYSINSNEITIGVGSDNNEQWDVLYGRSAIKLMDSKNETRNLKHYKQYTFVVDEDGTYTITFIEASDTTKLKNTMINIVCKNSVVTVDTIAYEDDNLPV